MEKSRKYYKGKKKEFENLNGGTLRRMIDSGELDRIAEEEPGGLWLYDGEPVSVEEQKGFTRFIDIINKTAIDILRAQTRETKEEHRQAAAANSWAALHAYELFLQGLTDKQIEAVEVALYKTRSQHTAAITSPDSLGYRYKKFDSNKLQYIQITGNEPRKRINRAIKEWDEQNPAQIRPGGTMTTARLKDYPYLYNLVLIYADMEEPPQIAAEAVAELEALDNFLAEPVADNTIALDYIERHFINGESWEDIADSMEAYYSHRIEDGEEEGYITPTRDAPRKQVERYLAQYNSAAAREQEAAQTAEE